FERRDVGVGAGALRASRVADPGVRRGDDCARIRARPRHARGGALDDRCGDRAVAQHLGPQARPRAGSPEISALRRRDALGCAPCAAIAARSTPMANADEVRDALFERIAYHAVSADIDEVLTLAKAWDLLTT